MRGLDEFEDAIVDEHRRRLRTFVRRKYGKFFRRNLARELDDDTPLDNFTNDDFLRERVHRSQSNYCYIVS